MGRRPVEAAAASAVRGGVAQRRGRGLTASPAPFILFRFLRSLAAAPFRGQVRRYGTVVVLCRLKVAPEVPPAATVTVRVAVCPAAREKPMGTRTATW